MSSKTPSKRTKRALVFAVSVIVVVAAGLLLFRDQGQFPELHLSSKELEQSIAASRLMRIRPREGVGGLSFGMSPEDVEEQLGPPEVRRDSPEVHQTTLHYRRLGLQLTFETEGAELRAIICMSDSRETLFSRRNKPAITFGGSTSEGIRVVSTFEEVKHAYGEPATSEQYFPERRGQPERSGDIVEHAYFNEDGEYVNALMVLVKDGHVVELHVVLPGWTRNSADIPEDLLLDQHNQRMHPSRRAGRFDN